jgi:hypothetical protein
VPAEAGRDQVHDDSRGGTEEESSTERTYSNQIKVQVQVKTETDQAAEWQKYLIVRYRLENNL